jgi:ankyrin repeat protein
MQLVEALASAGANLEAKCALSRTPLQWAAVRGDPLMVDLLCELGADVNSSDDTGSTALHEAVDQVL